MRKIFESFVTPANYTTSWSRYRLQIHSQILDVMESAIRRSSASWESANINGKISSEWVIQGKNQTDSEYPVLIRNSCTAFFCSLLRKARTDLNHMNRPCPNLDRWPFPTSLVPILLLQKFQLGHSPWIYHELPDIFLLLSMLTAPRSRSQFLCYRKPLLSACVIL